MPTVGVPFSRASSAMPSPPAPCGRWHWCHSSPVYREAFETVLFYQALWIQAAPAYALCSVACVAAAVALTGLGWLILRGTVHLPLGPFWCYVDPTGPAGGDFGEGYRRAPGGRHLAVHPVRFPVFLLWGLSDLHRPAVGEGGPDSDQRRRLRHTHYARRSEIWICRAGSYLSHYPGPLTGHRGAG